jgi:CBS domain-containing protein
VLASDLGATPTVTDELELQRRIDRASGLDELRELGAALPRVFVALVRGGRGALDIGRCLSAIVDTLTRRLITLAETELGPAPVPYAWVTCGSLARREQTVGSDQDNVLLLDDAYVPEEHDAWFVELARRVNEGLDTCGCPVCPGEVMARNPRWRAPLSAWRGNFEEWIDRPEVRAMQHLSIFFDMRTVAGDESLLAALMRSVRARVSRSPRFPSHLVANALLHEPPLGLFGRLTPAPRGVHKGTLDLKHGALVPIVDIARIYALTGGSTTVDTPERLRQARGRGDLDDGTGRELEEGLIFVAGLRMRHMASQVEAGVRPDSFVDPVELTTGERHRLIRILTAIRREQEALAHVHHADIVL